MRKSWMFFGFIGLFLMLAPQVLMPSVAQAAARQAIGSFGDWDAFKEIRKGQKVCYAISAPKEKAPKKLKRGAVYVMVTHWPAAKIQNQISISNGYPFKKGSIVSVTVGGRDFQLFTAGDRAWAWDTKGDNDITEAMKHGARLVVKGTSAHGSDTTDTYSLSGFGAAHNAIFKACH